MSAEGHAIGPIHEHYDLGLERDRLTLPLGVVEFERTKEIIHRHLPESPATVADVGGGPGAYSLWLASNGYTVLHRDLIALHVEQLQEQSARLDISIDSKVGDARSLDIADAASDAVLLLGPLYHLPDSEERLRALKEARRILRSGGVLFAAAISRWAPRLHGEVVQRLYLEFDVIREEVIGVERTGILPPLFPGSFSGYCHRPEELRQEIESCGFDCLDLVSVEGIAFALPDLDERLADDTDKTVVMDAARATERVPELLGLGPHLLATARRSE